MNLESSWTIYRTRFLVRARQLTEPLFFTDALGREHSGLPGDYLVESSPGFRRITPRAIFEDVYVPLVPSQPYSTLRAQTATDPSPPPLDRWNARTAAPPDHPPTAAWSG
jgi:hypothetical protein